MPKSPSVMPQMVKGKQSFDDEIRERHYRDRDRLWCLAACEVLDISEIAKLTKRVNELREADKQ